MRQSLSDGLKLFASGKLSALYEFSISLLQRNAQDPDGFFLLGLIAEAQGQGVKARELFSKAVEHDPKNSRFLIHLGRSLLNDGASDQAFSYACKAAGLMPRDALLEDMLGSLFSRLGEHDAAIPHFEKAVALAPNSARLHYNLGAAAQFIGNFDQAEKAYKTACALKPDFHRAWFSLVKLRRQTPEKNHLSGLKLQFENASEDAEAQLLLGHAIAKTYEDLGEYAESLDWLGRAKALMRAKVRYDFTQDRARFSALRGLPYEKLSAVPQKDAPRPVFIFGLPRTGTTLIDRIISKHSAVQSGGEMNVIHRLAAQNIQPEQIGETFRQVSRQKAKGKGVITDKTPLNYQYAPLIARLFPEAKLILVRRNAMDSCLSQYREVFDMIGHPYPYTFDLGRTAQHYAEFDTLMKDWVSRLSKDRLHVIRYEDLVRDQRGQTEQLLAFCGLGWESGCLDFHKNPDGVDSASSVQVRRPLYRESVERWRLYGAALNPLREALGENL